MESKHKIQLYIPAFEKKLDKIIIENLSAIPYCKKYLYHLLQHRRYYLTIYAAVLELAIENADQPKEQIVLIDYGAGNGLLGLFAGFCGFAKVYINDINPSFTDSVKELTTLLDISIDGIITGDIVAIADYFQSEKPTVIIGTDVIEHIYDLAAFFNEIQKINPKIVSVFTTASNPFNKHKIKKIERLQIKDEYEGGTPDDSILFGETAMASFIATREEIIRKNFSELNEQEIVQLTKLTRGLIETDILKAVRRYIDDNILPQGLLHPTNTCDPITGSWTERILTLSEYQQIYAEAGFEVKIYCGFYNEFSRGVKAIALKILNSYIKISGYSIAPFISIVGVPKNS